MPGYEPFLLRDFHVHTRWSDGQLTLREVIDLYGRTGRFDVIAITDHILMKKDLLARAGRLATLGRRAFGIREGQFDEYLEDVRREADRAWEEYGLLVVPGAEWEAANRDDLFSVTSLKHYPYVANSDFHKPRHLHSWKTLLKCEKSWGAVREALRANVDVALTHFRQESWPSAATRT